MNIVTVLLVILVLALFGALPVWPHAQSWGYGPSGGLLLLLIIVIIIVAVQGRGP